MTCLTAAQIGDTPESTMRATRIDRGHLRAPKKRADGSIVVEAHITRSGVFPYANPDGTVRYEWRPPEEVFREDALESFELVPVTDDHPPAMLSSTNAKEWARGSVGHVRADGDHVAASVAVYDAALISKMQSGKRDVSCGYDCDIDETPGVTPDGIRYDAIQRNIRGNHLAVVAHGRAGSARVRMDGAAIQLTEDDDMKVARTDAPFPPKKKPAQGEQPAAAAAPPEPGPGTEEGQAMAEGPEESKAEQTTEQPAPQAPAAQAPAAGGGSIEAKLSAALSQIAELIQQLTAAKAGAARADSLEAELAAARTELAARQARMDADAAAFAATVDARVALVATAGAVLGVSRFDATESNRQIMARVVEHVTGVTLGADRSDDYVTARYDAAIERHTAARAAGAQLADALAGRRNDAAPDANATRAAMVEHNRTRYLTGA